jgi:uncharacterized membrane protein YkvA (DUF1232 family)
MVFMTVKERIKEVKVLIPAVYLALLDKDTPFIAKLFAGLTIAYALSPIDLIPDFIPILGYLDDLIILPLLIRLTIKFIPSDLFENYKTQSRDIWEDGSPKKWYFALPIIFIWIVVISLIYKLIF